jgi:hypothetical protein
LEAALDMEEEEELIYGDLSFEEENNNGEDELLMNSPTANENDTHNVYMDEQRNQEEDTSIQLGNNSESKEDSTFVVNKESEKEQKEKIIEKERQKVLNTESNKQRKLKNPANFDGLDLYNVPHSHEALIITNLAWWTTDKQIQDLLTPFGKVVRLRFVEDKMNGKSTGECLVAFEHHKNASIAYNELGPNTIIDKKKLNFEVKSAHVFDRLKFLKRTDTKYINSHAQQQQHFHNKQQHNNNQHNNNNQQHNNNQHNNNNQQHGGNNPTFQNKNSCNNNSNSNNNNNFNKINPRCHNFKMILLFYNSDNKDFNLLRMTSVLLVLMEWEVEAWEMAA